MDVCVNFSQKNNMWYDITTGDVLTSNSAAKLISTKKRVYDRTRKLLASSYEELETCEVKQQVEDEKKIVMIDDYSTEYVVIQTENSLETSLVPIMRRLRIQYQIKELPIGKSMIIAQSEKNLLLTLLRSAKWDITFKYHNVLNLKSRNKGYETQKAVRLTKGQDRVFQMVENDKLISLLFDGHGGNEVIDYITKHHSFFKRFGHGTFPKTYEAVYNKVNELIEEFENMLERDVKTHNSGSTFVLAVQDLNTNQVYFASMGDSRVVWSIDNGTIFASNDHKPDSEGEIERIMELGGVVTTSKNDVPRVGGILALSRAFGDTELKPYVIQVADVYGPYDLVSGNYYIMASDGIFDVMDNREIAKRIASAQYLQPEFEAIFKASEQRMSRDDMSILAVKIN